MIKKMSNQHGYIPLVKSRVLYLGSSVPLETSIGLESVQQPLRDRYGGGGSNGFDVKVNGVDTILTIFSSGILLEYVEDPTASTWFPIQTLHVCCSVKPVRQGYGLRFVPVDSPEVGSSQDPPIFAAITRRSKGVKVLECHGFVCKTTDTALALVQSCTHAFQHKDGWLNDMPPLERLKQTSTRLIPAETILSQRSQPGFNGQPKQYSLDTKHHQQATCESQALVVNLPPGPKPPVQPAPPPQPSKGYFSNWNDSADQAIMISPQSPFFPGQSFIIEQEEKKEKKRKKSKKSRKEVEYLIIKKSAGTTPSVDNSRMDDCYDDDYDDDDDVAIVYPGDNQGIQEQPQVMSSTGYVPYYYGNGADSNAIGMGWGNDYYPSLDQGGLYYADQGGLYYPGLDQGGFYDPSYDQGAYYPAFDQADGNYPNYGYY